MILSVPNILTFLRIAFIPLFVLAFYQPYPWAYPLSAAIFGLAGLTDWLDGYLARRLNQTSAFGAFLDPVADKLMVAVALVVIVDRHGQGLLWLTFPTLVIIGREITISALREWMAEIGKRSSVAVSYLGKIKTTVQIIALLLLLYHHPIASLSTHFIGIVLLNIAAALTLWSMLVYLRAAYKVLQEYEN